MAGLGLLRSITHVMSAASISAAKGAGYARYLESKTVQPERGDYYLTPDGEAAQAPGRWLSEPDTLAALGIDSTEPVDGKHFIALMEGRNPDTGRWLRAEGANGARGGDFDTTFSAPKSVSTVWALADPWQREQIEGAHARAIEHTVAYMRENVPVVRRRYGGELVEERAKDLIATEYRHTTARGVSGAEAPDPQLHSHVVITAAVRQDDRCVAVASRPIFRAGKELGAFYRSSLADELAKEGYEIEKGTGKDGRYFELAGVPQRLIEEFSGRSREVARAAERFRARYGRRLELAERPLHGLDTSAAAAIGAGGVTLIERQKGGRLARKVKFVGCLDGVVVNNHMNVELTPLPAPPANVMTAATVADLLRVPKSTVKDWARP